MLKKGEELNEEVHLKQTAQDLFDAWTEELKQFKITYKLNDINSKKLIASQKLDKHLVLLVNKKVNDKSYFTLPLDHYKEGETLRQVINNKNHIFE